MWRVSWSIFLRLFVWFSCCFTREAPTDLSSRKKEQVLVFFSFLYIKRRKAETACPTVWLWVWYPAQSRAAATTEPAWVLKYWSECLSECSWHTNRPKEWEIWRERKRERERDREREGGREREIERERERERGRETERHTDRHREKERKRERERERERERCFFEGLPTTLVHHYRFDETKTHDLYAAML